MNSLVVVALSLCLALAASSPCSDSCNGVCTLTKQNCDGAVIMGPLCNVGFGVCSAACGAVCGCLDGCDAQCKPDFDTCNTNAAGNPILAVQCTVQYNICTGNCQAGCSVQTALTVVGSTLGAGK